MQQAIGNIAERLRQLDAQVVLLTRYADANQASTAMAMLGQSIGSGGPGGANGPQIVSGTAVVNFGAGASHASVEVAGQAQIRPGALVCAWLKPEATADHSADEHLVETIKVFASGIKEGVGFTLHALNTSEAFEPGRPSEAALGRSGGVGNAGGAGKASIGAAPNLGGRGTLLYGRWSVGWMYMQ